MYDFQIGQFTIFTLKVKRIFWREAQVPVCRHFAGRRPAPNLSGRLLLESLRGNVPARQHDDAVPPSGLDLAF